MNFIRLSLLLVFFLSPLSYANLYYGELQLDGTMSSKDVLTLTCREVISGTGLLKAPRIVLKTKKFEFTGTIECDNDCFITAQEPFDENIFTRKGQGKFYIRIEQPETVHDEKSENAPSKEFTIEESVFTWRGTELIEIATAIEQKQDEKAIELLNTYTSIAQNRRYLTNYMLMAGLMDQLTLAKKLIHMGADVSGSDDEHGQEHIITAILSRKSDFVSLLLSEGANPNAVSRGKTMMDNQPALIVAVLQNDLPTVKALVQAPTIKINEKNFSWNTALMYAAYHGYKDSVEVLLKAGADASLRSQNWLKAEDYARERGHHEIERMLKKK